MKNDIGYTPEQAKYKKKSQKKGRPRAKHKHEYIDVDLRIPINDSFIEVKTGAKEYSRKGVVCKHCGRIDNIISLPFRDEKWEEEKQTLPVYFAENIIAKTAVPYEQKHE